MAYAELAWRDFIALNFPAATSPQGKPEPAPSREHGLDYRGGDYTAVWQTWPEARDIFLPGSGDPCLLRSARVTRPRQPVSGRMRRGGLN